jgi:type I restriction enzyme, S subunit
MIAMETIGHLITNNLDIWTNAIERKSAPGRGRSKQFRLYGIEKLRALILDLAVRGKLLPQDASDEPVSELVKKIAREKARLIKAGDLRKPREQVINGKPRTPFRIPSTWRWIRLDEVGAIIGGGTPSSADPENFADPGRGSSWITPADLGSGFSDLYISHGARDLSEKGLESSSATVMPKGTVLFTSRAPIGYVAIAKNPISTNQGFKSIVPYVPDCSRYVATVMRAFATDIDAQAPGTTFKEVSGKIVAAIPFPLPPLPEQRRIVAKVDELMALCDGLEAGTYKAIESHELLSERLCATLTNGRDTEEIAENWARIETHFDVLFTTEASIDQLKRTILQLAMMGRLSQQEPTDEPASELLKRINKEIVAYSKAQGIRLSQPDPIKAEALRFPAPFGWRWTRLSALFKVITDGDHQPPPKADEGVAFLTIGNITTGKLEFEDCRLVPEGYFRSLAPYRTPAKGDILYTVVGATYGRPAIVETDREFCVQRHIAILKPVENLNRRFMAWLLTSPLVYEQASQSTTGTAQPTIALRPLRNFVVPLPPLAEQKRIVATIDHLMSLCDALRVRLIQNEKERIQFADSVAARALA